ncbi:MAG: M20/M25/M40 family metallo-hydrolase, partial [Cyanobacteria bacterium P01_H01_bin.58]
MNFVLKVLPHQEEARKWPPILVGAHYDTVPGTPGADDNASGLAVLLELARHAVAHPPRRPVWFVAFDMEEYGLLGSQAYAAELKSVGQPLRLMLSLEMLGYCDRTPHSQRYPSPLLRPFYPNTGNFVALIGNLAAIPDLIWLKRCLQQAGAQGQWLPVPQQGKLIPAVRRSDHAPFWDQGYRAVMVTDTAFLRNPHYHKASDTLATLDLTFMAQACLGLMQALERLT